MKHESLIPEKLGNDANRLLAAVFRYFKNNAVLLACIFCLVILYDANIWDYSYWITTLIVWLAGGWQSDSNSR